MKIRGAGVNMADILSLTTSINKGIKRYALLASRGAWNPTWSHGNKLWEGFSHFHLEIGYATDARAFGNVQAMSTLGN